MASIKRHIVLGGLLAGALAIPGLASADDSALATPVATPTPTAWYQNIQVNGYIDAYYQADLNELSAVSGNGGAPVDAYDSSALSDRAYNNEVNSFAFGGGQLTLGENDSNTGTGAFVDLMLGGMENVYDPLANIWSEDDQGVDIAEAYVTQSLGNATFTLGKFATPIGYESTYQPSDANFSRSLLYQQEPTFQTGLELSYKLPAGFTATGWVDDGFGEVFGSIGSLDYAVDNGKGYGAQVAYSGIKNLNLTGTWYLANDFQTTNTPVTNNSVYNQISSAEETDAVVSYTLSDAFSFAGEYLNQSLLGNLASDNVNAALNYAQNNGYAVYATWNTPLANLSLSPRFTQWYEPNLGVPSATVGETPFQLDDYTLTLKYQMGKLAHILEYEATVANGEAVFNGGAGDSKPTSLQQTLTYAAVYSF